MRPECPVLTPPEQRAEAEEGTHCGAPALPAGRLGDLETGRVSTQRTRRWFSFISMSTLSAENFMRYRIKSYLLSVSIVWVPFRTVPLTCGRVCVPTLRPLQCPRGSWTWSCPPPGGPGEWRPHRRRKPGFSCWTREGAGVIQVRWAEWGQRGGLRLTPYRHRWPHTDLFKRTPLSSFVSLEGLEAVTPLAESTPSTCWSIEKAREFQKNIYFWFIDYTKAFDCVDQNILENSSRDGNRHHLTCLLRNLYAAQEATVRTRHGTADCFKIGKGVLQGCILSLLLI